MTGHLEYTVQYRCPPNLMDWCEFNGHKYRHLAPARYEYEQAVAAEFEPTVEYRIGVRTVSEWQRLIDEDVAA